MALFFFFQGEVGEQIWAAMIGSKAEYLFPILVLYRTGFTNPVDLANPTKQ